MKIFDLHCDSLYKFVEIGERYSFFENDGHLSEKALIKGGYLAQCFAIYTPSEFCGEDAYSFFKSQYSRFAKLLSESAVLTSANNSKEIVNNLKTNKISAVLTVENSEYLNGKTERLIESEELGVKILGLIHNGENCLGYPHSPNKELNDLPLKRFGREVIEFLNDSPIIVDVSHLNCGGFMDVAEISKKPFIATHSACRTLQDNSRNLFDNQIKLIAKSGGVVGIPFYSKFLNGRNKTECEDIIRHLKYLIKVGGEDVAALGSDFDGIDCELFLKNGGEMQILADGIIKNFGFSIAEKICYKNVLRIYGKIKFGL